MLSYMRDNKIEMRIAVVLLLICIGLSLTTDTFFTLSNFTSLLNNNSINLIWAVGLLVILISGGIDISFAVASSVVQYVAAQALIGMGGGNWFFGFLLCGVIGIGLGLVNMFLIHTFRIITIVVTIATYNAFFGLLMFFTRGRSIYNLPDWWVDRIFIFEQQTADGSWAELNLSVGVMVVCVFATWVLTQKTNLGTPALCLWRQPRRSAPGWGQHGRDAGHCLWLDGLDGRNCRAHAGQHRAGSGAQRALWPRA